MAKVKGQGLAFVAILGLFASSAAQASDLRPADSAVAVKNVQNAGVIRRGAPVRHGNKARSEAGLILLGLAGAAVIGGIIIATTGNSKPVSP